MASLSLQAGDLPTSSSYLAQALFLSLQLHPKLVLDTIDSIVSIAKRLATEGKFSDVAVLGSELLGVVMEVGGEKLRSEELKASGVLAQQVCEESFFFTTAGKTKVQSQKRPLVGGNCWEGKGAKTSGRRPSFADQRFLGF
jgi:hypothetical protein